MQDEGVEASRNIIIKMQDGTACAHEHLHALEAGGFSNGCQETNEGYALVSKVASASNFVNR